MAEGHVEDEFPACPDCGGRRLAGLRLGAESTAWIALWRRKRIGWLRRNEKLTKVGANVCLECGVVKLAADNLRSLRQAVEDPPA